MHKKIRRLKFFLPAHQKVFTFTNPNTGWNSFSSKLFPLQIVYDGPEEVSMGSRDRRASG
jgi:hypothetical protein